MYDILIVDDEILTVEIIKSQFDWASLGIGKVFTAYSMKQACKVFTSHNIDIMICDIEMPQGTGLELLQWVKDNSFTTVIIFLTSHAKFVYCKRAIELGSMDYILKPVEYDKLKEAIQQAIERVKEQKRMEEYMDYGKSWLDNRNILIKQFWFELLADTLGPVNNGIVLKAQQRNIPFDVSDKYLVVLAGIKQNSMHEKSLERWDMENALNSLASDFISSLVTTTITLDTRRILYIIAAKHTLEVNPEELSNQCKRIADEVRKNLDVDISYYIGEFTTVDMLSKQFRELEILERNDVASNNTVILLNRDMKQNVKYICPDLQTWKMLLTEGKIDDLRLVAKRYVHTLVESGSIDAGTLKKFQQDFMHIVYQVLEKRNIQPNSIFEQKESLEIFSEANLSIEGMLNFIDFIIEKVILNYLECEIQPRSVVEKVISFISGNIYNSLSRDEIARSVYLNPEYLSRLFKKETGISLLEYIQNEKIKIAKELLVETRLSVSDIASKLGYSNFAYFAQLFSKNTGQTPGVYRKSRE